MESAPGDHTQPHTSAKVSLSRSGGHGKLVLTGARLTWIEVALQDTEGQPLPGEPFVLTKASGDQTHEGTLDGDGLRRVEEISVGTYRVTFPEREAVGWHLVLPEADRAAWVAFTLLDHKGVPVPDEAFRIRLPGGAVREGRLDAQGAARVEGLAAGRYVVAFPGISPDAFQAAPRTAGAAAGAAAGRGGATVHAVQQGEDMLTIASAYGFDYWETLYFHDNNHALRQDRPDPFTLKEGDRVFIPERRDTVETGQRHTFRLYPPAPVRLVLEDHDGTPFAGKRYELAAGGETFTGTTGADGLVEHAVPLAAGEGTLKLWLADDAEPEVWEVELGHLDPVSTLSGVQDRLINLGYLEEDERESTPGPETRAALRAFQEDHGLQPDGEIDAATRWRLHEVYSAGDPEHILRLPCETGKQHTFRLNPPRTAPVRLVLEDHDGTPFAGKRYELTAGGETFTGTTGADGLVEHAVPLAAGEGTLKLWLADDAEPEVWEVELGHLDPVSTLSGVQDRLINLGYLEEDERESTPGPETRAALRAFQEDHGLQPDGEIDDATRELLVRVCGV